MMVESIVVPLDGKPRAERALGPARALAEAFHAEIQLVRSTWEEPPTGPAQELNAAAAVVRSEGTPVPVNARVMSGMFASTAVVSVVGEHPDAVVCMTTRAHTGASEVLMGSVAEEVLERVTVPVVLLGPACADGEAAPPDLAGGTMVVCFDGSDASASIVPVVEEWAPALGAAIRVVIVTHRDGEFVGDVDSGPARKQAQTLADRLEATGLDVRLELLDGLDPARTIASYAANANAALVLTATRGHGFTRAILGSTAMRIVHHSPCPVLVRRPT
jgi:nucleotide-binding universal stress UspA family protein